MRSPRLSGRQAGESRNPGEDGFASSSFGLLSKIKCGSLPFPHCGTAEGPLCLWAGGFTLTLSVFLGFSIEAGCAWLGVVTSDNLPLRALLLLRLGGDSSENPQWLEEPLAFS